MFSAFKERRPWAASAVAFIFDPVLGMLYLNRGRLALIYLGAEIVVVVAGLAMFPFLAAQFVDTTFGLLVSLPIRLIGAAHGYVLAGRRPASEPMRWYSRWYALVLICVAFPAAGLTVRTFLFQSFDMRSASMSPTLNIGDYFFVKKFSYSGAAPRRGDVIVFHVVQGQGMVSYVKRIAGLPGDRVQLVGGRVYVNGAAVKLARAPQSRTDCRFDPCAPVPEYFESLPGGREHRILQATTDGPLDNTTVFAVPAGSYFVLGDNRDDSNDSRSGLGFVLAGNIVGRVAVKFVDGRQHRLTWQGVD